MACKSNKATKYLVTDPKPIEALHAEPERAVLSGVMLAPQSLSEVRAKLHPEDFTSPSHGMIYEAILHVADSGQPVDSTTVSTRLNELGQLRLVGDGVALSGLAYLNSVVFSTPSSANVSAHADLVTKRTRMRRTAEAVERALAKVRENPDDAREILRDVLERVDDPEVKAPFHLVIMNDEDYPDEERPIEWMVRPLMLGPGRVAVVVGPGGVGKTWVVQTISLCVENGCEGLGGLVPAGPPRRTLHIDTDQGIRATRRRYRRLAAGLGVKRRPALLALRDAMRDDPSFRPTDAAKWRELFRRFDLVVIDALASLLSSFGLDENSAADVRSVLDALQFASDAENCTVIVIAHTGNDVRDEQGRRVQQSRPRGSSGIQQAAGVIWSFTGDTERGAIRTARRTRDAADDDGDDDLVSEFSYRIERVDVEVSGIRQRDGGPVFGMAVARSGAPSRRGRGSASSELRTEILRAVDAGGHRSGTSIEGAVTGKGTTIRAVFKELCAARLIMTRPDGELYVTDEGRACLDS
jgi:hypothetical protein